MKKDGFDLVLYLLIYIYIYIYKHMVSKIVTQEKKNYNHNNDLKNVCND